MTIFIIFFYWSKTI